MAGAFGVSVLGDASGHTLLSVDPTSMTVSVDPSSQGGTPLSAPLLPANATEVTVHAIVDHSIIEVRQGPWVVMRFRALVACKACAGALRITTHDPFQCQLGWAGAVFVANTDLNVK